MQEVSKHIGVRACSPSHSLHSHGSLLQCITRTVK